MSFSRHGLANVAACAIIASLGASCRTAGFKRAFMALDQQGDRKRTTFYADTSEIFCVGELVSGRADVSVQARIRATQVYDPSLDRSVRTDRVSWTGEELPGKSPDTFVSFKLEKALPGAPVSAPAVPYPVGSYICDLSIDGVDEEAVNFVIDFPDCPKFAPVTGIACAGWVRPGSQCFGASGTSCSCDPPSGAWQCR